MTCPHAQTTAILAVFDEAPPDFAEHLARCPACQAVVAEHRQTVAVLTPLLDERPDEPGAAPPRRRWPIIAALAAAAALLILLPDASAPPPAPLPALTALDALDADLLSLELELALMDLED